MGKVKSIELTQGRQTIVDSDDYIKFGQVKWYYGCGGYAIRNRNKEGADSYNRVTVLLHREIMNAEQGSMIDHINGDTLDNRKENLRFCTSSQNNINQKLRKDNKSGFKGVIWNKEAKKWRAEVGCKGKSVFVGDFMNLQEAARAYDKAAIELFGEFAHLNFPNKD